MSQRTIVCFDLNGTLIYRERHTRTYVPRPFVSELLPIAFEHYDVGVWSSGMRKNMDPIVKKVFGPYYGQLKFKYYRDMCDSEPTEEKPWATVKDLMKLPFNGSDGSIIMVDDTKEKMKNMTERDYHYEIQTFSGQSDDAELHKLMSYLVIRQLDEILDELDRLSTGS